MLEFTDKTISISFSSRTVLDVNTHSNITTKSIVDIQVHSSVEKKTKEFQINTGDALTTKDDDKIRRN